ncbi:MAG TPA: CPBP family intramembrane glutamic endopeptidase [Actinomycetota bacterium]|jgi:membrane protease YdiL (CAAX protease family)|nr:CPBP family intramembrane glutamic endopeptidase [Actinomycetota bacterium]
MTQTLAREAIRVPRRVIAAICLGFPALYMANSYMPWSVDLFVHNDRSAWTAFWTSAIILHWTTVLMCVVLMRRYGMRLPDLRIASSPRRIVRGLLVLLVVGLVLGQLARVITVPEFFLLDLTEHWEMYPISGLQFVFWPFAALTAGVCEEFVYRGFLAAALESRGIKTRTALVLATIVWIGVHGLAGVFFFPVYLVVGLLLTAIVLRRRRLDDAVVFHVVMDSLAAFR